MNNDFKKWMQAAIVLVCSIAVAGAATTTNELPRFEDIYKLLREHSDLDKAQLDRAATAGLLNELHGQIELVTNSTAESAIINADASALSRATNYDNGFAYFRIGRVKADVANQIATKFHEMSKEKIKGVVLDLRFADGDDYEAAAKTADLFLNTEQPLLNWGDHLIRSTTKTNAISVPVAVLINGSTRGAAEALAAIMREMQSGLLIGSKTMGSAGIFKEFSLDNGQRVRIAVAQIKIANGKTLPVDGVHPDIQMKVNPEDEKAYFENPYKVIAKDSSSDDTNSVAALSKTNQPRLNEAELVRQHREGLDLRDETAERPKVVDSTGHSISDPVLLRALDLLKALAVVQQKKT